MRNLSKIFVCFAIILLTSCNPYGQKITYDQLEIYYKDGVTKEEASKAGDYIIAEKIVSNLNKKRSFQITKKHGRFIFKMVVNPELVSNVEFMQLASQATESLSKDVFNGADVDIELCDAPFKTFKVIKMSDWRTFTNQSYEIRYPSSWSFTENTNDATKFTLLNNETYDGKQKAIIELITININDPSTTIDHYTQVLENNVKDPSQIVDGKIIQSVADTANGREFRKMIVTGTIKNVEVPQRIEQYYWVVNDKVYLLRTTIDVHPDQDFLIYLTEDIMDSFKIY